LLAILQPDGEHFGGDAFRASQPLSNVSASAFDFDDCLVDCVKIEGGDR
jgi:hypothetical protein